MLSDSLDEVGKFVVDHGRRQDMLNVGGRAETGHYCKEQEHAVYVCSN